MRKCPFQPIFIGKGASGCHGIFVFQMKFNDDMRKNLHANVVTSKKQSNTVYVTRRRSRTNHKAESVEESMEEPRSCTHTMLHQCVKLEDSIW